MEQSGVTFNLAIWNILQSGGCIATVSLSMMPIWCYLALAPIWPIWKLDQSGNLETEAIWPTLTNLIVLEDSVQATTRY